MRTTPLPILVTLLLPASVGSAVAHAYQSNALPPFDSTVPQPPSEIAIASSRAVEPHFSTIEVTGASGQRGDDALSHMAAGDTSRRSVVGVRILAPGTDTFAWQATSVNAHKTEGSYRFTLAAAETSAISLDHVWARATAGQSTTGAAYFTVTSKGQPDHLVGVSTPVAAMAALHETTNDNGVMKMRPVPSITLDPGKPVSFQPGGYHVMLTGLKNPLKAGDSFPLTLTFEHASPVSVTVKVEAAGGAGAMGGMNHGGAAMPGMPGMQGH